MGAEIGGQHLHGGTPGAELLCEVAEPVRAARHQDEVVVIRQQTGEFGADAGGSSGDESDRASHTPSMHQPLA